MKDLENALAKYRDGLAALADALPYTRLDKDGTAIIGLRELCADGKKPGLFLKWELQDWDSEVDACYYGAADGQWQHHGWKVDDMVEKLRDADSERIDCWHCLSWLANHRRSAVEFLSDAEKKRLASILGFDQIAEEKRP